ncbi:MAG: DUF1080 domain-containing protein [Ignavibacteriales bacterium]|nr:DUF1080 domain-containing protein [Ignavibacteriales bacterium]
MNRIILAAVFLLVQSVSSPAAGRGIRDCVCAPSEDGAKHIALNGRILLKDDFNTLKELTKEFQPLSDGWKVKVWHSGFKQGTEGLESVWESGHNPVIVYEGSFKDVVVEVDFRFRKEQDPARNAFCRINPLSRQLDPGAYCISTWANINAAGRTRGLVLEYDLWNAGPTGVAAQLGTFEPDTWYTMRLEVIGEDAMVSCNGMVVTGNYRTFGLQKNWLAIGVGKGTHELRRLRVYEAVPNPEWKKPDAKAEPYVPLESIPPREKLSQAVLDKIQNMEQLFDGKTLNGWIQAPVAPIALGREDVINPAKFAKRISQKSDRVSAFIHERLDSSARAGMNAVLAGETDPKKTVSPLVRGINAIVAVGGALYEEKRFEGFRLRQKTKELLRKNPQGFELARLNRLLLEDVYADELTKSPDISWVAKDGIMASTGAGRGVIYTEKDYVNVRLIFQVRQSSGNHFPGVLIFCQRPPAGELGMDALDGIQFGVPSGSHWDYRPGFNRAGDHFTRPQKIRFNEREWAQVEIFVNGEKGTVRMAVAQPVGTRPIEVLDFHDSTAVRAGPIALQMHNALLFDEYRMIRIETNPKEKRLITLE